MEECSTQFAAAFHLLSTIPSFPQLFSSNPFPKRLVLEPVHQEDRDSFPLL
jgi:hypothetical protein